MKNLTLMQLNELKERFWQKNKHNELGEIQLPLFFNYLHKKLFK